MSEYLKNKTQRFKVAERIIKLLGIVSSMIHSHSPDQTSRKEEGLPFLTGLKYVLKQGESKSYSA